MPGDGLFDPLGVDRVDADRPRVRASAPFVVAAVCLALTLALIAVAWIRDDGDRGEPRAVSPITRVEAPPQPTASLPTASQPTASSPRVPAQPGTAAVLPVATPPGLPPLGADQEVEIQNGVRIIRPRRSDASPPPSQTVTVPGLPARRP